MLQVSVFPSLFEPPTLPLLRVRRELSRDRFQDQVFGHVEISVPSL
jgi:hypothetical protein